MLPSRKRLRPDAPDLRQRLAEERLHCRPGVRVGLLVVGERQAVALAVAVRGRVGEAVERALEIEDSE